MKKRSKWYEFAREKCANKFMRIMKLTCLLMLVFALHLSAESVAQKIVSAKFSDETLKEVFREIKTQTGFYFMYNSREVDVRQRVSLELNKVSLETALERIFEHLPYGFEVTEGYVLVVARPKTVTDTKAKKKEIRGLVTDEKGIKLPGVSILVKGTGMGTVTDMEGAFKLEVPAEEEIMLVFSFIGMETKEIKADTLFMKVVLKESVEQVDEVVVTGYQKIDKRVLSSSIASIKGEDLIGGNAISVDQMLQGRLAGVAVLNQTSTPGAAPKIRIRGSSSITGNREPVWVVDGIVLDEPVQLSTEELNSMDRVNLIGNAISSLNPNDIERIDILKDASATAIYGVKAANGVIVVTTKKGRTGKPRINYAGSISVMTPPSYEVMRLMNSAERVELSEEMHRKGLQFYTYQPTSMGYEGALMDLWNKELSYDEFRQKVKDLKEMNTDWYDLLFRASVSHQHSIAVSGASDNTDYYFSVGYANDQGVNKKEDLDRFNALIKVNTRFTPNLKIGMNMSGALTDTKRPHNSIDVYQYAAQTSRAIPVYDEEGELFYYDNAFGITENLPFNILNELKESGSTVKNQALRFDISLDWDILPSLKFSSIIGLTTNNNYQTYWASEKSYYISQKRGTSYGTPLPTVVDDELATKSKIPMGGELVKEDTRNMRYTIRNSFAYQKVWGHHQLAAMVGSEISSSKYDALKSTQWGYLPDRGKKFVNIDLETWKGYAEMVSMTPDVITDNLTNIVSWYGTFTYSYADRYIVNFNIRTDGSNKFGQDKSVRFLPVWSASAKWNLHNEVFMKPVEWMDEFAIRMSYGIQGNVHPDQTPNLIVQMGAMDNISKEYESTLYKLPNNDLKWEKTKSYNLGIDFSFFQSWLSGTLEIYKKVGEDQVIQKTLAPSTGANYVAINDGDVNNSGWELSVNVNPIHGKDWNWGISFNTAKNYNKVKNAGEELSVTWSDYVNGTLVRNGRSINSFYAYRFKGLNDEGLPTFYGESEKDEDGVAIITTQEEAFDAAFVYAGRREPTLSGGFSTNVRFKRLTMNANFSFALGNKIRLNNLYYESGQALPFPQQNMSSEFVDRWREPGDDTVIPALSDDAMTFGPYDRKYPIANNRWDMYNKSDLRVVSGDFLRCRSLSLRYDIAPEWLRKFYITAASLSFDVSNPFVIKSKDLKGRDPEQVTMGSGTVPPQRGYSLRLNVSF